jgi:hypothetical protein
MPRRTPPADSPLDFADQPAPRNFRRIASRAALAVSGCASTTR